MLTTSEVVPAWGTEGLTGLGNLRHQSQGAWLAAGSGHGSTGITWEPITDSSPGPRVGSLCGAAMSRAAPPSRGPCSAEPALGHQGLPFNTDTKTLPPGIRTVAFCEILAGSKIQPERCLSGKSGVEGGRRGGLQKVSLSEAGRGNVARGAPGTLGLVTTHHVPPRDLGQVQKS